MSGKYYFADFAINVRNNEITVTQDLSQIIKNFLDSGITFKSKIYEFTFLNINIVNFNSSDYYWGYLSKILPENNIEIADEGEILSDIQENLIVAKSHFLIDTYSSRIIYHPTRNIDSSLFLSAFKKLFEEFCSQKNIDKEIILMNIEKEIVILEEINDFEQIKQISLHLRPSNPRSQPMWDETDRRIRNIGVTDYYERYISKSELGLDVLSDDELKGKLQMAEDGYGEANVSGIKNGVSTLIKTGKNAIFNRFRFDQNNPEIFVEKVSNFISSFID